MEDFKQSQVISERERAYLLAVLWLVGGAW